MCVTPGPFTTNDSDTVLYMVGTVSRHLGYHANQYELLIILQITAVSW